MCTVSMVGDYYIHRTLPETFPGVDTYKINSWPIRDLGLEIDGLKLDVSLLKIQIEELKKLLLAAKAYDEALGEPDCEVDEKVALIKKLAEIVGVDMKEVFS